MTTIQQDAFGVHRAPTKDRARPGRNAGTIAWVSQVVVYEQGVDKALQLLGVSRGGANALADWRDEMVFRSGLSQSEFRSWVDTETNLLGNRSLAFFIWAIA